MCQKTSLDLHNQQNKGNARFTNCQLNLIFFETQRLALKVACPALQKIRGASLYSAKYSETGQEPGQN
jgi:hypothetical protein